MVRIIESIKFIVHSFWFLVKSLWTIGHKIAAIAAINNKMLNSCGYK